GGCHAGVNWAAAVGGQFETERLSGSGLGPAGGGQRTKMFSSTTGSSALTVRGATFPHGRVHTFEYPTTYHLTVDYRLGADENRQAKQIPDAAIRYVVPESMTTKPGKKRTVGRSASTDVRPGDLKSKVRLNANHLDTEVHGSHALANLIMEMLEELGFFPDAVADQVA